MVDLTRTANYHFIPENSIFAISMLKDKAMKAVIIWVLLYVLVLSLVSCDHTGPPHFANALPRNISVGDTLKKLDSLVKAKKYSQKNEALAYARTAIEISRGSGDTLNLVLAHKIMGNAFNQYNVDSTYHYYYRALRLAEKAKVLDSFPQVIYNIAILYFRAFDYKNTIILLDSAIKMGMTGGKWDIVADAYNILGNVYMNIGLNPEAMNIYRKAADLSKQKKLYPQFGTSLANQSHYETIPQKAILQYKEAIRNLLKQPGFEPEISQILCNIGLLMVNPDSAITYYNKAIEIANQSGSKDLLISTYNNLSYSYMDKGDIRTAESVIREKAIPQAQADSNYDLLATLYDTYADIQQVRGNYSKALKYQKLALEYRTRADQKIAGEQVRLLSALLEAKNKELMISNQGMELQLQRSLKNQYRTISLFTGIIIIGLILAFFWYRQHTRFKIQKVRLDSARRIIDAGENEKTEMGRELHDISTQLSMGLRRIVDDLPFTEEAYREQLHAEIESVRLTIRDLSHRMHSVTAGASTLPGLIIPYCEEIRKQGSVNLDYALGPEIPELSQHMVLHCFRIVQELLSNAGRHASGSTVELDIYWSGILFINYTDNGPGFEPKGVAGTMGLLNIQDRIVLLGGKYKLNTSPGQGTSWEITIPSSPYANHTKYLS